jgi:hypothetical protein
MCIKRIIFTRIFCEKIALLEVCTVSKACSMASSSNTLQQKEGNG